MSLLNDKGMGNTGRSICSGENAVNRLISGMEESVDRTGGWLLCVSCDGSEKGKIA
jgi:hypothetical protein